MSYLLATAAILTVGVALAHSYYGERLIITRLLRREDLPTLGGSDVLTKQTLRFAWHLTSIAWFGLAGVLLVLGSEVEPTSEAGLLISDAGSSEQTIGLIITLVFAVSAVVDAALSRLRHPAWPIFAAIAVLTWIGV